MSRPNEDLAQALLDKMAEVASEAQVSNSHTLMTLAELLIHDDRFDGRLASLTWKFLEAVWEEHRGLTPAQYRQRMAA